MALGDGGSADIKVERLSKLFEIPADPLLRSASPEIYQIDGAITYRKKESATITLQFEFAGISVFNEVVTITLPAPTFLVYGDGNYYADGNYYGTAFAERLTRQKFGVAGKSNYCQIRTTIEGTNDFEINEIYCTLRVVT